MISIIGAGRIGSELAFLLAQRGFASRLIDIVQGLPQGHALDIMHSAQAGLSQVQASNEFQDMSDSELIINTAGFPRKPGMERTELLKKNREIVKSVAEKIRDFAPDSIVIQVSNPVDIMTYIMKKTTGLERNRVMGMGGILDCQRLAFHLSRELDAEPREIDPLVLGEHGESMVPVFSNSLFQGRPVSSLLSQAQMEEITNKTRASGAEVIGLKGGTVFAPVIAIASMVEAVLRDKKQTLPVSACLEGEYGLENICMGVPAVLGKSGIEKIVEIELSEQEMKSLRESGEKLKKIISSLV
jgi:malate dehydrogenase